MILASDYDGTLRTKELVDRYDVEMIEKWQKAGHTFIIVTGRSMQTFENEIAKNGFHPDFIVTNNGGALYDAQLNQVKVNEIAFDDAMALYEELKQVKCEAIVLNEGKYRAVDVLDEANYQPVGDPGAMSVEDIIKGKRIAQFVVSIKDEVLKKQLVKYIEKNYGEVVTPFINVGCIDIVPKGCDKGKGLSQAVAILGVDGDVFAIGDANNDLPMIDAFIGCSVHHADEEIKKHAQYVFTSVGEAIDYFMK